MLADRLTNKIAVGWYLAPYECRGAVWLRFMVTTFIKLSQLRRVSDASRSPRE